MSVVATKELEHSYYAAAAAVWRRNHPDCRSRPMCVASAAPSPLLHAFLLRRLRHHVLHLQLHHQDQYSVPNVNWHFSELVLFFTFEPFQRLKFFAKIMLQTLISVRKMAVLYFGHCKKTRLYVLLLQVAKGGCFSRRRWWWC